MTPNEIQNAELRLGYIFTEPGDIIQHKEKLEKATSLGPMLREIGIQDKSDALAETFEVIIGAIYQDGGYGIIKRLVAKWFRPQIEAL